MGRAVGVRRRRGCERIADLDVRAGCERISILPLSGFCQPVLTGAAGLPAGGGRELSSGGVSSGSVGDCS